MAIEDTQDDTQTETAYIGTATYSPEDNKLRLYPYARLDKEDYDRVHGAGFIWAPKQELFVAPKWTPQRNDLLIELCGEIGDEDTSLVDRAEDRADRFDTYSEKRQDEANRAKAAVDEIADGIPLGQPILVGHSSERHARKHAEKIRNGMTKAVRLWDTAKYWTQRAKGAIRHAKYKERPDVRARRIKSIEAEKRKHQRSIDEATKFLKAWNMPELDRAKAIAISNYDHISRCFSLADYPRSSEASQYEGQMSLWSALKDDIITFEQARDIAIAAHQGSNAYNQRYVDHCENRLAYERAMLEEQGGLVAQRFELEPGGTVLIDNTWVTIIRINSTGGVPVSVTTNARYVRIRGIEEIIDYKPPTEEAATAVKAATKLLPLANYPGEGFLEMTNAQWKRLPRDCGFTRKVDATETVGAHRARYRYSGSFKLQQVFITDAKRVDAPAIGKADAEPAPAIPAPVPTLPAFLTRDTQTSNKGSDAFNQMRSQLREGITVVSVPQLFPTPVPIAQEMVELAEIQQGDEILEPSAGTARILDAIRELGDDWCKRTAVEINYNLCRELQQRDPQATIINTDFLEYAPAERYDKILMNPPFEKAQDIVHILHAIDLLKPGGTLVALCAGGPRQEDKLKPIVEEYGGTWKRLPSGSFASAGTGVNVVLMHFTTPTIAESEPVDDVPSNDNIQLQMF